MATRKPLVLINGSMQELPFGDSVQGASFSGALAPEFVDSGDSQTIPARYQLIVHGSFDLSGTLDVQGRFIIL